MGEIQGRGAQRGWREEERNNIILFQLKIFLNVLDKHVNTFENVSLEKSPQSECDISS